jgi:hypothetical protein
MPDPGEAMVLRLAGRVADCAAPDGFEMAPQRLEGLLALALETPGDRRTPRDFGRVAGAHPTHGLREPLWGQRRIQAELVRLGFKVSARTVAKYMRRPYAGKPSSGWREFLKRHARDIWACDFFCVRTIWFQTFYVFFAIRHANREVLHVQVTRHPTAEWVTQQIVECCSWDREPPRFLIHDRDADRLMALPPSAPAAARWALTMVLSIICRLSRDLAARTANIPDHQKN